MVSSQSKISNLLWDGTLSSSDFCIASHVFAKKWTMFISNLPEWSWVPCQKRSQIVAHEVDGYLSLENVCLVRSNKEDPDGIIHAEEQPDNSHQDDTFDNAILVHIRNCEVHHYDFHIVYSSSYRVPVLYFRAYYNDGQPLPMNDIEKDLPADSVKVLMESKWTFITQEEHPYLNRPWYMLHPCATREWMKLLLETDSVRHKDGVALEQYLVSWFSVVGQVFRLKVPFEMLNGSNLAAVDDLLWNNTSCGSRIL